MKSKETALRSHKMKQLFIFAVLFVCMALPAVAGGTGTGTGTGTTDTSVTGTLASRMNDLLEIIGSPWVKGIALIALIILALGMFISHEQGVIKKFIPWIAACIVFMSAGSITDKFIDVNKDGDTFKIDTTMITVPYSSGGEYFG